MNKVCQADIAQATSPSPQKQDDAGPENAETATRKQPRASIPEQSTASAPPYQPRVLTQDPTAISITRPPPRSPSTSHAHPGHHQRSPISRTKAQEPDIRMVVSPSELPSTKLAEMNQLLAEQEERYQTQIALIRDAEYPTPDAKAKRQVSLKASHATRCSQIRRSFGVSLR